MLVQMTLLFTTGFYLLLAYYNIFAQDALLSTMGLTATYPLDQINPLLGLVTISLRCLGVAFFILAFIIGHMIAIPDKHPAALRTCHMTTFLFAVLYGHRAFYDSNTSQAGREASIQHMAINSVLLALSYAASKTLPPASSPGICPVSAKKGM